jgi:hypothetical protein
MTWTTTHRAYLRGGYRYSLATDGERWRWTVHCRGKRVAQAMALDVNGARDEAKRWIDQREEEVKRG